MDRKQTGLGGHRSEKKPGWTAWLGCLRELTKNLNFHDHRVRLCGVFKSMGGSIGLLNAATRSWALAAASGR